MMGALQKIESDSAVAADKAGKPSTANIVKIDISDSNLDQAVDDMFNKGCSVKLERQPTNQLWTVTGNCPVK
jgi:hypothetical protein